MQRFTLSIVMLFGWALTTWAATPAQLTSLRAVNQIDNVAAGRGLPVTLEATVTYFRPLERTMFVQDGGLAIFVQATTDAKLVPGDRILVRGTTHSGLRPFVESKDITLLRHEKLPNPQPATFEELISGSHDCMRVSLRGVVRSADEELKGDVRGADRLPQRDERLEMMSDGGLIDVEIDLSDRRKFEDFLDAEVEVVGVAGGKFDGKMEQTGVILHVTSLDDVKILKLAGGNPWALPITPMEQILHGYKVRDLTARVRVHGTITYYEPGSAVVLQDGSKSLWISTLERKPLSVGEVASAVGFSDAHTGFLRLNEAELREEANVHGSVVPLQVGWAELARSSKIFDLVSIDGHVITENRETAQDEYIVSSEGHLFTAIFRYNTINRLSNEVVPAMKHLPIGSTVRVTGISIPQDSNPFKRNVPFDILLRSTDDITMLARPSPLNVRNLALLVGLLLLVVFGVTARGWSLERRVRRETAVAATVERRRSRILEDINRAQMLDETLVQVTELLSYKLHGASCWLRLPDGTTLGDCPAENTARPLQMIEHAIPSHSGEALGTIYAAINPRSKFRAAGPEALFNAAQLAALAIETGGLYSDLVHRSEFDLLTDTHNRFSLGKRLDALIEGERRQDGAFGLIYIDLDQFKLVNDLYGHGVGDGYLQEVALRIKRQLRPSDMLARLGGDEFAVVVADVHDCADVEEISARLDRCFDEPFLLAGNSIRGSASVGIAVYPNDGTTRDALLSAADAAMYKAKRTMHQVEGASTADRI